MDAQASLTPGSFRELFSAAPDAMLVSDADGHIVAANDRSAELFGYPLDELLRLSVEDLVPHERRGVHGGHRAAFMRTPSTRRMQARPGGLTGLRKDGEQFPVSISLAPIQNHGENFVIAAIRDMTLERAAERALVAAKNRAEAMSRELETFSYTVAHDLRAPLRAIDGYTRSVVESSDPALTGDNVAALQRVIANTQRMAQLIDDLLALFRIVRGELALGDVDVTALATEAVERRRAASPERQLDATIQPGMRALADARLVRVAIDNLLDNAWKFTQPVPHAHIELGRMADPPHAFYVRDDGVGFDMTHAGRLFQPFQRLHKASEFEGTGIGLATVQKVVSRHGGRVWAESAPNQGATVWFTLEAEDH
jgi:PAS domain S-box-containing protein